MTPWLVLPNQLFKSFFTLPKDTILCLVEEPLFFSDEARSTTFAKIKLAYTRACMKRFESKLRGSGFSKTHYIEFDELRNVNLEKRLGAIGDTFKYFPFTDGLLEAKLKRMSNVTLIPAQQDDPSFLYTTAELSEYYNGTESDKNKFFQTAFYKHFRHKTGILMTKQGGYTGGKLTFDSENRSKLRPDTVLPSAFTASSKEYVESLMEAAEYVKRFFPDNPGDLSAIDALADGKLSGYFAIDHEGAEDQLRKFWSERLKQFGPYQDAFLDMSANAGIKSYLRSGTLFHSTISPYINNGLLTPDQVIREALKMSEKVPVQSLEGFIRQVIGWREFIRYVYLFKGDEMRAANQLGNNKRLDHRWYTGSLGVPPVDDAIKYAFKFGYLHHILRLMVVSNFMNLARIHPHEVYRWMLDFSLDSYDWVMLGNVYGMATWASPVMSTKPYISGSNYILKMSNYPHNGWCATWDSLYYLFLDANEDLFRCNGRMNMMLANLRKKDSETKAKLFANAKKFLGTFQTYGKHKLDD